MTIIVLLILAGVSLNLVGGSNGILGRAQKAAKATEIASFQESKELADAEVLMEMYASGTGNSLYDYIVEQCKKNADKMYETENGTYWIDEEGNLHYTDKASGNDSKLIKDKDGNTVIKEVTIDGTTEDMTTTESLTTEIETAIDKLLEEYHKKYGTENQEKTFEEFIQEKCNEAGKDYVETENGGKIYPDGNGNLIYSDSNGNNTTFITKDNGEVAVKEMTTPSGEVKDMTTEGSLKTEIEKAIEDLKKEYDKSGSDKTFEEWLKDKCEENGGSVSTSTGGTIASNGDGTFSYADGTEPPSTADFATSETGKVEIKKTEINKPESTGGSGNNPGGETLPSKDLAVGDIIFQYSDESEWTNQVTVTAVPKEGVDITGYTLQTSRNGVTWNNSASQTFTSNGIFYVRLYNGSKYGAAATANVTNVDGVKPVVTALTSNTNSLTFTATDETSGIVGYSVTESATKPTEFEPCENTKTLTQTVSGTQGKTYYVWIKDQAGNVSEGKSVTLGEVQGITTADINFTYSNTEWTNQNVTVTAAPKEGVDITGYTMQVSTDGTNWTDGNSHEFEANGSLYVSLRDAAGQRAKTMATANVEKIDKNAPTIGSLSITTNSFSFKITEPEEESGLAGYEITETDVEPTSFDDISGTEFETTVSNKKNDKTYYIWAKDIAGGVSKKTVNLNPVLIPTEGDLTATTSSWSGTTATVTFSTTTSYEIQYTTKQSTDDKDWNTGTSTTVPSGTTIFVRLWDGVNGSTTKISHRPVLTYTVTYNGNGYTGGSTATSTHNYGEAKALTANGFSRTGYTFAGWNTAANGSGTNYSNSQSVTDLANTQGANVTLYAKWTINQYTLTFNTNGGNAINAQKYNYGATISYPTPTRSGYKFTGWSPKPTTMPAANTTVTASWELDFQPATSAISASNYGDTVQYSANGVTNWQIFLKEGSNVYIIAADYVPNSGFSAGLTKNGSYKVYGSSQSQLVSALTTTSNWSSYVNSTYADLATGGPTKAQFCASYNAKYGTSHPNGLGSGNTFTVTNKVAPYIITDTSKAFAYWLASACSDLPNSVWRAGYNGGVGYTDYDYDRGVRPLVRLKSTVKAQKSGSSWVLSN